MLALAVYPALQDASRAPSLRFPSPNSAMKSAACGSSAVVGAGPLGQQAYETGVEERWTKQQEEVRDRIILDDALDFDAFTFAGLSHIGGLDISFDKKEATRAFATLVVLTYPGGASPSCHVLGQQSLTCKHLARDAMRVRAHAGVPHHPALRPGLPCVPRVCSAPRAHLCVAGIKPSCLSPSHSC